VRRLKAEVQLARRVSHPNVCRIYDLGSHVLEHSEASIHFLTMEFVDGEPLGQRVRTGGALPLDEALSYARQLLAGLSTAHRAGTLHRDLKSDNVILRMGSDGTVSPVILDFGLARSLDPGARGLTSGTNQAFVGTLSYMAPEQIEGKQLSAASDLYAFGVLWFEMLTGALPFGAESAAANALERLRKRPASPSSVNPHLPKALDAIVLGCLARHPGDRFQSADEVLEALKAWERSPGPSRGSARRVIALGLASTLVATVAGWALLTDGSRQDVPELRRWQSSAAMVPRSATERTEGAPADPTQQPLASESQPAASVAPAARSRVVKDTPPPGARDQGLLGRATPAAMLPPVSKADTASLPEVAQSLIDETAARQGGQELGQRGLAESPPTPAPPVVEPPPDPAQAPASPKQASHRWENPFEAVVQSAQPEE
jgi:serine/threonine protein kinase